MVTNSQYFVFAMWSNSMTLPNHNMIKITLSKPIVKKQIKLKDSKPILRERIFDKFLKKNKSCISFIITETKIFTEFNIFRICRLFLPINTQYFIKKI